MWNFLKCPLVCMLHNTIGLETERSDSQLRYQNTIVHTWLVLTVCCLEVWLLSRAIIHYWHGGVHNLTLAMIPYMVQWGSFKYIYEVFWLLIPQDDWHIIPIDTNYICSCGIAAESLRAKFVVIYNKSLTKFCRIPLATLICSFLHLTFLFFFISLT